MPIPEPTTISIVCEKIANTVLERCNKLARFSESANCLTRTFCCDAMKEAIATAEGWFESAGLTTQIDDAGNLVGAQTEDLKQPIFLLGSHLDTVANAGKFDGTLGVLLGLAAVEALNELNLILNFKLGVVGFSEEEGVRFNLPYIGSSAIAGSFDPAILDVKDRSGVTIRTALTEFCGRNVNPTHCGFNNRPVIGFLEAHIEQGPVLEHYELPVGIVTAIASQIRCEFRFEGKAGHAGTIPMSMRRDALAAAAEFISVVEKTGKWTSELFATVGNLQINPNVSNVIPGSVVARLDLRHAQDDLCKTSFKKIKNAAEEIASNRKIDVSIETTLNQPAVRMDAALSDSLAASIKELDFTPLRIPSGAGHDAVMMARLAPTCMLFVRCTGGISHHPDEDVDLADVKTALEVIVKSLVRISNNQER